jgi:hypothetical protein
MFALQLAISPTKRVNQQRAYHILLRYDLQKVLSVQQHSHVQRIVFKHVHKILFFKCEIKGFLIVDHVAH